MRPDGIGKQVRLVHDVMLDVLVASLSVVYVIFIQACRYSMMTLVKLIHHHITEFLLSQWDILIGKPSGTGIPVGYWGDPLTA